MMFPASPQFHRNVSSIALNGISNSSFRPGPACCSLFSGLIGI
ncbi:MAG TPA: hypothetical protein DEB17_01765 [Chlorobaculum sp.]|uniref:Uncharacterized protein n=1 Tax=Chlorobaculum tepidum (strain ATCC 49652 / DSM 12025 / NBRC 103806 / TLS) TaxID=194439 RepID=Q8KDG4_CHLTE|nr:hypothetical protein CT1086 [Chlorobaculum tepidum TLS]HBU22726.1 hypothetical protein [Chlorobaculum sp.]